MTPHSPAPAARRPSTPDELDRLLSGYFQNQMPRPWPGAPVTDVEPSTWRASRSGSTSRWALAASVALLIGLCWYTGRGIAPVDRQPSMSPGTATEKHILGEMEKHRSGVEPEMLKR